MKIKLTSKIAKSASIVGFAVATYAALTFAQSYSDGHKVLYDIQKPPPVSLLDAYSLAAGKLGDATNRFYCVSATCLDNTNRLSTGWLFHFLDARGDGANVKVFFNRTVGVDDQSAQVLKR